MPVYVNGHPPQSWEVQVKTFVQGRYAHLAEADAFPEGGARRAQEAGYPPGWIDALPGRVAGAYCGCGYALEGVDLSGVRLAVDLGCGAGLDSRLLAERLLAERLLAERPGAEKNETGWVLALDMALPMLRRVREASQGVTGPAGVSLPAGVPIHPALGDIENLPLAGGVADLVFANASLNLMVDKRAALAEVFRILRPGGRLIARELFREGALPAEIAEDPQAWNASLGGVLEEGDWRGMLEEAGFTGIDISGHRPFAPVIAARLEALKPI
jgi:SAM-dependent methyltransferase